MTHGIVHIGLYVVFGIVLLPVYAMIAGWLLGRPRDFRTVAIGLASIAGLILAMVIATWIGGQLIGFVMGL